MARSSSLSTRNKYFLCAVVVVIVFFALLFSLSHGLPLFAKNEKTTPLFYFPETYAEDLAAFASELVALEKEFYPFYGQESAEKLYPDALWQMIALVSIKRQMFRENPTWRSAWRLASAHAQAAEAYEQDINSFIDLWEEFRQENASINSQTSFLFLPGVASDVGIFENGLREIQKNAVELKKVTARQKRCLVIPWVHCAREMVKPVVLTRISDVPPLPQVHVETAREILRARHISPRRFSVATPCFGGDSATFLLWERLIEERYIFTPKLAGDSFFRDLAISGTNDMQVRLAGLPYAWQPEMNWYLCPDLGYVTELATLAQLVELAEKMPIDGLNTPLESVRILEEELVNGHQVTSEIAERYITELSAVATNAVIPLEVRKKAEERIALWRSQSGNFSLVGPRIRFEADQYVKAGPSKSPEGKVSALVTRGYPSFLYLAWNQSVWLGEPLVLTRPETRSTGPLHGYYEVTKKIIPEVLRHIMEISVAKIQ